MKAKMINGAKAALAIVMLAGVGACGGGGSSGAGSTSTGSETSTAQQISGRVIDGYIRGAVVFWDCNKNGVQDGDEAGVLTTAQGVYQIIDFSTKGCPLLAYVGPTAVDEDRPLQLGSAYTMQAAPGQNDLITPFTTLVAGRVSSSGITVDQAKADVASIFGLTENVLVDYKAKPSAPLLAAAKDVASVLQTTQAQGVFTESATKTYDFLLQKYADSGFRAAIATGVTPFVNSYKSLVEQMTLMIQGNDNNRLVRRVTYPVAAQNAELDAIVSAVNARSGVRYNYPNWSSFTTDELKAFAQTINRLNAVQSNSPNSTMLQQIQQRRTDMFEKASLRMNKAVGYDGPLVGTWDFFSSDPGATLDYGLEALSISIDLGLDAVTLITIRPPVVTGGLHKSVAMNKKRLKTQLEIFKNMSSAAECARALDKLVDDADDLPSAVVDVVASCGSFFAGHMKDIVGTLKAGKLTDGLSAMLDASGGLYDGASEKDRALAAFKMSTSLLGLGHDLLQPLMKDPVTSKLLAGLDIEIQMLNARVAAMELEKAATEKHVEKENAAMAKYNEEVAKAWRSYFVSFMEIYGNYYFQVIDVSSSSSSSSSSNANPSGLASGSFSVAANSYAGTPFAVPVGTNSCSFSASGTWSFGAGGYDANGYTGVPVPAWGNTRMTSVPIGRLVAVAPDGFKSIGIASAQVYPEGSVLTFIMNDAADISLNAYSDNSGSLTVSYSCSSSVDIPASAFLRGVNVALSSDGFNGADTLMNAPPYLVVANSAEWDVVVPVAGTYELLATYAAVASRPVVISFNGSVAFPAALSAITGGWIPANRQTISQGVVGLSAGLNVMRVSRGGVFPHIKGFTLRRTAAP